MSNQTKRFSKAAHDLQDILDEIGPFAKPPVVETPIVKGRWTVTGLNGDNFPEDRVSADDQKASGS